MAPVVSTVISVILTVGVLVSVITASVAVIVVVVNGPPGGELKRIQISMKIVVRNFVFNIVLKSSI
jgi:uncharacterized membrane protein